MLALAFLLIVLVCFLVLMATLKPEPGVELVKIRLQAIRGLSETQHQQQDPELDQVARTGILARLLASRAGQKLADLLLQSGSGRSVSSFLAIDAVAALFVGTVVGCLCESLLAGLGAALFGGALYPLGLHMQRNRRVERFAGQLPTAAAMMARALRAGHSVPQMLELAADQSKDPLREDFAQLSREQRLGIPLRQALLNMSRRMPLPDLRFLVSAILIQKETGGDLIQILERTAALIEERLRIRGQVRTFTAQGRASAWVLTALPIALLLLLTLVMPTYTSMLFHDPAGQRMLMFGAVLLLVGGLVIRRIVNIEI